MAPRSSVVAVLCALVCVSWCAPAPVLPFGWLLSNTALRTSEFVLPFHEGFGESNHTLQATFQWSPDSTPVAVRFEAGRFTPAMADKVYVSTGDSSADYSAVATAVLPEPETDLTTGSGIITFTLDGQKLWSTQVKYDFTHSLRRKFSLKEFAFSYSSGGGFTRCFPSGTLHTVDWKRERGSSNFTTTTFTCDDKRRPITLQNASLVTDSDAAASLPFLPWLVKAVEFSGNVTQLQSYEYKLLNSVCDGPTTVSTLVATLVDLDGVAVTVSVKSTGSMGGCGSFLTTNTVVPRAAWRQLTGDMRQAIQTLFPRN